MRAVVQRVLRARVTVDDRVVGAIVGPPAARLLIFAGVHRQDTEAEAMLLARKISQLRIFADEEGRMNRSLEELGGESLVISQFTLYGDTAKGRRPSWLAAAGPEHAEPLIDAVVARLQALGATVATGRFRAGMAVELVNDGPVTVLVET